VKVKVGYIEERREVYRASPARLRAVKGMPNRDIGLPVQSTRRYAPAATFVVNAMLRGAVKTLTAVKPKEMPPGYFQAQ
jgi:hypothetical protein